MFGYSTRYDFITRMVTIVNYHHLDMIRSFRWVGCIISSEKQSIKAKRILFDPKHFVTMRLLKVRVI